MEHTLSFPSSRPAFIQRVLRSRYSKALAPWGIPLLLMLIWQILVQSGVISTRVLPAPASVVQAGIQLASTGELFHHIKVTVTLGDRVVVLEAGQIALDLTVPLPRPRHRGDPAFAALVEEILRRILSGETGKSKSAPSSSILVHSN